MLGCTAASTPRERYRGWRSHHRAPGEPRRRAPRTRVDHRTASTSTIPSVWWRSCGSPTFRWRGLLIVNLCDERRQRDGARIALPCRGARARGPRGRRERCCYGAAGTLRDARAQRAAPPRRARGSTPPSSPPERHDGGDANLRVRRLWRRRAGRRPALRPLGPRLLATPFRRCSGPGAGAVGSLAGAGVDARRARRAF
jgi:hypothetical protein